MEIDIPSAEGAHLTGRLGPVAVAFMVIAAAAPLTVIGGNLPLAMGLGNGAGAPVGFLIAAVIMLLFSVGFIAMTPHVHDAGAFFAYVTKGLGNRPGAGIACVALITYTAIQVGIYGYIGWTLNDTITTHGGPKVPWYVYAFAVLIIVGVLGYRHIDLSAKVLGVALILEIGVVVVLDLVVLAAKPGPGSITLDSFKPSVFTSGSLGIAVLFAMTGFLGFEATAVVRDEARDPKKTIPRATYAAVLIIGVFYALTAWVFVISIGPEHVIATAKRTLDGNGNMLFDTTQHTLGTGGRDIVNTLLVSSLFACLLSFHNVLARYQFVLAGRGLMPKKLDAVHPRHQSPSVSSLVQTATAVILVGAFALFGTDPLVGVFGSMAGVATVGMVILMFTTSVAVLIFFLRHPDLRATSTWQCAVAPMLACIGLLIAGWLVLSNFTLVTGGSATLSTILAAVPFAGFAVGWSLYQRSQRSTPPGDPANTGRHDTRH